VMRVKGHRGWPFGAQAPGLDDARPRRRTRAGGCFAQAHFKWLRAALAVGRWCGKRKITATG